MDKGMDESATLAVVVARLDDLRKDFADLRDEFRRAHEDKVSRNEWIQRNTYVDSKFNDLGREISQLREEAAAKRAPWWAFGSLIVAGVAVAWQVASAILSK